MTHYQKMAEETVNNGLAALGGAMTTYDHAEMVKAVSATLHQADQAAALRVVRAVEAKQNELLRSASEDGYYIAKGWTKPLIEAANAAKEIKAETSVEATRQTIPPTSGKESQERECNCGKPKHHKDKCNHIVCGTTHGDIEPCSTPHALFTRGKEDQ